MILKTITYKSILLNSSSNVDVDFLWDMALIFLGMAIVFFIIVFLYKNKLFKRSTKKETKRSELAPIISNFLFHSSQDSKEEQKEYVNLKIEIREYLKDSSFRKILAEILFDLQKDVSGTIEKRLFKLYKELGLHHDALANLKSWRWHIISKGIIELTQMQVSESYHLITKFVNDKRGTIRKQAEIAAIKLRTKGVTHILDHTKYPISEWQQLKMIEALSSLKEYSPPPFKSWLISDNKDVVLFSLRLIKHYNQNDAAASIIELVKHKDRQVQLTAIQCIKDFNFTEAKPVLRAVFLNCTAEVKIQILGAIAIFGDETDIPFLNGIVLKEPNFLVKSKARTAINTINPGSILPKKDIIKTQALDKGFEVDSLEKEPVEIKTFDDTKITISEEHIEIETLEELDVYELEDTKPKTINTVDTKEEEFVIEEEQEEISFDFDIISENTDEIISKELGLLPSENDTLSEEHYKENKIEEDFENLSYNEKDNYLNKIENTASSNPADFLEHVMENEEQSELRFKAFKKLKDLKTDSRDKEITEQDEKQEIALDVIEESKMLSIFYPLYKKANDLDSKLILIEQMALVGDEKEIGFLKTIEANNEQTISKAIEKAIKRITNNYTLKTDDTNGENKLSVNKEEVLETLDEIISPEFKLELETILETENESVMDDERLPIELCFLYDEFGIKPSKPDDSEFSFELSEEFYLNQDNILRI